MAKRAMKPAAHQRIKAAPPKRSLTALAKEVSELPRRAPHTWLDDLSESDRRDVMLVATKLANRTLTNVAGIADAWQQAGLPCSRNKLSALVNSIRKGIKQ